MINIVTINITKINEYLSNWNLCTDEITKIPCLGIFHSTQWDGGFDNEDCDSETISNFYSDMSEMKDFIKDFITTTKVKKCIIGKFYKYRWFEEWSNLEQIDIYKKLSEILLLNKINNESEEGIEIEIEQNWDIIFKIIEGGFRYISCSSIFFYEIGVIVEPTHNFEFLFYTKNTNVYKQMLCNLLEKHEKLKLYE